MILDKIKNQKIFIAGGIILISMGFLFPLLTQPLWFNIVVKIREAVNTGDSGHLVLASAFTNFLYAVQSTLFFSGTMFVLYALGLELMLKRLKISLVVFSTIIFLHWLDSQVFYLLWEPVTTILSLLVSLFLSQKLFEKTSSFFYVFIVSIQVIFAFQWLNIMPIFSPYLMGQSDILYSIKISGIYLQAGAVLNFMGFAFFILFIFSAFITATLFISYSKNIQIMRENYKKEREIQDIKEKALENRIYREINSLVHDLKTPLVTIRGLNSLLTSCRSQEKLEEYSERIENSAGKMGEMISSFLYESSRQKLKTAELISYMRAQFPLEDDTIKIDIDMEEDLPEIFVNKVRVARALINIMENAIIAPCKHPYKHIRIEAKNTNNGVSIMIQDNGDGIKESDILLIWEVGYSTRNTSGLGLPFAKQIIEDNKGSIKLISQPDQGTSVTVFLPLG